MKESDFQKHEFHDATEFFDMLHTTVESIAIPPLESYELFSPPYSTTIIGAYDLNRRENQPAYIILRLQKEYEIHYSLIQAERTYDHWNIGGILTNFDIFALEARSLHDLVYVLPNQIMNREKILMYELPEKKKESLGEYGRRLLALIFEKWGVII